MTAPALAGGAVPVGDERRLIVMIGAPGAGKGTQAERLAEILGLPHVSTGELFRDALREGSELGDQVPDALTIEVVARRLARSDSASGAILDGFPRTRAQAEALDEILARTDDRVVAALYVEVPSDALVDRLSGRLTCSDDDQHVYHVTARPPRQPGLCDLCGAPLVRRKDDEPETIRTRLDRQLPPMYEVIDHYAEAGVLFAVPGDQPAEEVTEDLLHSLASATRP
jgi:adenylate kinase